MTNKSRLGLKCILLVILSIAMMTIDNRSVYFDHSRNIMNYLAVPIHVLVDKPVNFIRFLGTTFSTQQQVIAENQKLKDDQILLKTKLQKYLALEQENNELRALLGSTAEMMDLLLVAKVLSLDMEPFVQQVVVDKGSLDGTFVGQPVLDSQGVMGQVISVNNKSSRVMLVTDTKSAVPVQTLNGTVRSMAVGLGYSGELSLLHIPVTTELKEGDELITSGLGKRYPAGYPVGVVTSMKVVPGQRFVDVKLRPYAAVHNSRHVVLVWPDIPKEDL